MYSQLFQFYRGQAEVYDSTRHALLRGRDTMLGLSVAHLRHLREASPKKRFVWVDIGGGTGTSTLTHCDQLTLPACRLQCRNDE